MMEKDTKRWQKAEVARLQNEVKSAKKKLEAVAKELAITVASLSAAKAKLTAAAERHSSAVRQAKRSSAAAADSAEAASGPSPAEIESLERAMDAAAQAVTEAEAKMHVAASAEAAAKSAASSAEALLAQFGAVAKGTAGTTDTGFIGVQSKPANANFITMAAPSRTEPEGRTATGGGCVVPNRLCQSVLWRLRSLLHPCPRARVLMRLKRTHICQSSTRAAPVTEAPSATHLSDSCPADAVFQPAAITMHPA